MNQMLRPPTPSTTLDVDVMRSFVAIAEGGSIAAAAGRVGRTPAAVSMQIKKLEETMGRTFFDRTRQGMTPTPDGERLLEHARRMIELNRAALQEFSMPELSGTISIGVIDSFGGLRLMDVLAGFARSHPKVRVDVSMNTTVHLGPLLDSGDLDLALITPGCTEALRETDVILREEQLVWIAAERSRAARETPLPLAVANDGCAWRQLAADAIRDNRIEARIAYVSDFDEGQLAAARADLAIAPMPRSYVTDGLVELGAKDGLPPLGLSRIVLRLGENPSQAVRALAERMAETYGVCLPN